MWTSLYWEKGPWPGKLALAARPRGEGWLEDEIKSWRQAGLVASGQLVTKGLSPHAAIASVASARGTPIPETDQQPNWIDHYAAVLASTK